jgi:hypothetical protein
MKIKLFVAAAVAMVPLAALAAEGQKAPSGETVSFDTLDANKDGRISMPEASADPKLVESFSTADKNGDGYLDNQEYDNSREPPK